MGKTTCCLALDVGDRRIGVAIGTLEAGLARPLLSLDRLGDEEDMRIFKELRQLVKAEKAEVIVVGDPLNMDDSSGPRSQICRAFARRLKQAFRQTHVVLFDERLSSFSADAWMERDGVRPAQRKHKRDAYAAAVILLDYFESRKTEQKDARQE